jgi:mannose PTS system EIIC component
MVGEALLSAAVGSLLWLDRFQAVQGMLCRPLVCCPVVGLVAGDLAAGTFSGIVYELLWLCRPPVGGFIPADTTLGAMVCAGIAAGIRNESQVPVESLVCLSFLISLPICFLGRRAERPLRFALGVLAETAEQDLIEHGERRFYRHVLGALGVGYLVAFALLFPALLCGTLLTGAVVPLVPGWAWSGFGLGYYLIPMVGLAELASQFDVSSDWVLFAIGLVLGITGSVVLFHP